MAQIELDAAKIRDSSAIDNYYENHLKSIVKLDSPSPSNRSSKSSRSKRKISYDDGSSSTASNSDIEESYDAIAITKKENTPTYTLRFPQNQNDLLSDGDGSLVVVNHSSDKNIATTHIERVAIQNSNDIQFGNKTFYNGPVVIKYMLDDKNKNWIQRNDSAPIDNVVNGILNNGFDGSQVNNINNGEVKLENVNNKKLLRLKKYSLTRKTLFLSLLTIFCLLAIIILLTIYLSSSKNHEGENLKLGDGDDLRKNVAINSTIGKDLLPGKVLRMISRDEWLAQPANNELDDLELPVKKYIITHTATENCETQAACTLRVRLIQTFHMESKNWDDIGYNFLIGGDGSVYEGRGWNKQGAHTKGYNIGSIGLAYIGTFNKILPNQRQLNAGFLLMKQGVELFKVVPDYYIYGHRQLIPSESPGAAFFEIIKTWDHWKNDTLV